MHLDPFASWFAFTLICLECSLMVSFSQPRLAGIQIDSYRPLALGGAPWFQRLSHTTRL